MRSSEFSIRIKQYERTDMRLGRHVNHDSRSLQYQALKLQRGSPLFSVRHYSSMPTLDQGSLGSCTGNAATKCMAASMFWPSMGNLLSATDAKADEEYAKGVYSDATKLDTYKGQWPDEDTGSDGLAVAKVLQKRGLISGYRHATSMSAVLNTLMVQPVIVGTEWRTDMYDPEPTGQVKINGDVEGGHEYVLDEIDVENQLVWMQNSWSDDWGQQGRAYFTWVDFAKLLSADGDCTVFTPSGLPSPVPVPVPADPTSTFKVAAKRWVALPHTSKPNVLFEKQVATFLSSLEEL